MRLLHAIFKHHKKIQEHKAKHRGSHKPKHHGPKPHHTGNTDSGGTNRTFDRPSGEWHRQG